MSEDTESQTIRLLREMRKEINGRFDEVDLRIDGLTYIVTMLAGNMGGHDQRFQNLEDAVEGMKPE